MRDAVARAVAGLHLASSSRWGKLDAPRKSNAYGRDLKRGIERRVAELASRPSELTPVQIESIRRWFLDRLDRFEDLSSFQLCHHHLDADDILYDPSADRATLIDCANIQFSRAARDLCGLRDKNWVGGAEQWEAFLETYFAHSPPERRREYQEEAPFFSAFVLLSKARNCVLRTPGDGAAALGDARVLKDLLELAEESEGASTSRKA